MDALVVPHELNLSQTGRGPLEDCRGMAYHCCSDRTCGRDIGVSLRECVNVSDLSISAQVHLREYMVRVHLTAPFIEERRMIIIPHVLCNMCEFACVLMGLFGSKATHASCGTRAV